MCSRIVFFLCLIIISCKKDSSETAILVIGHGGMGLNFSASIYHDNSEEAFKLALDINEVDGVEMDVRLSADGDLWAFHDEELDAETDNTGCIENMTYSQLNGTKYKGFGSEQMKRLKDMSLDPKDKRIFLDIKHFNACAGNIHDVNDFIAALGDLPEYYKDPSRIRMVTSNANWISALLSAGYRVVFSSDSEAEIDAVFENFPETGGVVIKNKSVTKEQIDKYCADNKSVYIYEVRSPKKLKEARKKNPVGVMSDDVQSAILEYK